MADLDPEDPTQTLDELGEFHIELAVEAQPSAEAQEDLDVAEAEETAEERETPETEAAAEAQGARKDVGDLYGVHVPPSDDNDMTAPEDRDAYQDASLGESFMEALEEHATENGPEPEHELDVVDDSDYDHPGHHKSDHRDRPVADKGSGGPGGV